jgi:enolase-phosphatase E1
VTPPFDAARTRALLLDVEGTTTPVDFVYGTLFPFAAARVEEFLRRHGEEADCAALIEQLRCQREVDAQRTPGVPPWPRATAEEGARSAAAYVRWLIARDSKITPLKSLQGKIWEAGYQAGELRGSVFPDVPRAFQRWRKQNRRIAIFSSGSVLAQELLFRHSTAGDLTFYIESYFDTNTGPKRESESYRRIAAQLKLAPDEILFLSDAAAELDAALTAGLQTGLSLRPGIIPPAASPHTAIRSFDEVFP